MIDLEILLSGLAMVLRWDLFLLMGVGVLIGAVAGAIPGLTGGIGIALFLPLTFHFPALQALVFLLSIYTGSTWGGAVTAILINTPGSPAAAATAFDGYPLTRKGQASRALGLSLSASMSGALIGALALMIALEPLGRFTLRLHAPERFLIAFFGLSIIASLRQKNQAKAFLAGLFGFLLGTIGMSPTGAMRGTFGWMYLLEGIPFIPVLIGVFVIPEIFKLMQEQYITEKLVVPNHSLGEVMKGFWETFRHPVTLIRSALIGVGVGAVPAAGSTVATLISYNQAQVLSSDDEEKFGEGSPKGIIAAEGANSSSEGGALATMLALGIPGGMGTAVLLGALITQGWVPGPRLIVEHMEVIYGIIWAQFFEALLLLPLGIIIAYFASKIIFVRTSILIPIISVFVMAGAYSLKYSFVDVYLLIFFGLVAWFMREYDYPLIALILGLLLGPMADAEFLRTYQRYAGDFTVFLTRPISLFLLLLTVGLLLYPYFKQLRRR